MECSSVQVYISLINRVVDVQQRFTTHQKCMIVKIIAYTIFEGFVCGLSRSLAYPVYVIYYCVTIPVACMYH